MNIPNSVTSIWNNAFTRCSSLTSVTIPNSVTSIGEYAFSGCSGLTSISIPNGVTSIGEYAFSGCSGLTSISIPNGVTSIEGSAFRDCRGLTTVTIPNSVTSIRDYAFQNCSGLTTVSIPNSVTSIRDYAFRNCSGLTDVFCYAKNVPNTNYNTFRDSYIEYATLHVPESAINAYKEKAPWSGFGNIVTLTGEEPEVKKCATPTIAYENGTLNFECETEGVTFVPNIRITSENRGTLNGGRISLDIVSTCTISVYATKDGYENSETATETITLNGSDASERLRVSDLTRMIEKYLQQKDE